MAFFHVLREKSRTGLGFGVLAFLVWLHMSVFIDFTPVPTATGGRGDEQKRKSECNNEKDWKFLHGMDLMIFTSANVGIFR
jgi:hypothetical protein